MKRKKEEKNNFPYNMLKTFGMEQGSYPDDIYDTALYVLDLIDKSENQQNTEMLMMYFKDGKNNQEIGKAFQISSNKARNCILFFGNKIRGHERYQELLRKGRKRYEQEHDKKQDSVSQMCISDSAKDLLIYCGFQNVSDVLALSGADLKRLHNKEQYGAKRQMSEKMYQEITDELVDFYGADAEEYQITDKKNLSYPNNLFFECGFGIVQGEYSESFLEKLDDLLCETDSNETKLCYKRTMLHFRDRLTYQKVAERCGVRCDAVRESAAKMIRRLKHPSGTRKVVRLISEEMKQNPSLKADKTMQYFLSVYNQEETNPTPNEIKIECLHFTIRTYNILKRNQLITVQDILDKGAEGILHMENVGAACFGEIADCMIHEFGVNPLEWKYRKIS